MALSMSRPCPLLTCSSSALEDFWWKCCACARIFLRRNIIFLLRRACCEAALQLVTLLQLLVDWCSVAFGQRARFLRVHLSLP